MIERCLIGLAGAVLLAACGQQSPPSPDKADTPPVANQSATNAEAPVPAPAAEETTNGRVSRFTKLDEASCGPRKTVEETGDWDRTCTGLDGYSLNWGSGDLREDLSVIRGGKATPLGIPVKVANGAFDSIAPTIEWRGPMGAPADLLVVRVRVANDQGEDDGGHLTVVKLGASPCIVGIVRPRPGQSEEARQIADSAPSGCV